MSLKIKNEAYTCCAKPRQPKWLTIRQDQGPKCPMSKRRLVLRSSAERRRINLRESRPNADRPSRPRDCHRSSATFRRPNTSTAHTNLRSRCYRRCRRSRYNSPSPSTTQESRWCARAGSRARTRSSRSCPRDAPGARCR